MTLVVAPLSMTPAQRERLGIPAGGEALVELALTHPSRRHQAGAGADNERLEFLGDAVLQLIVTEELFKMFPDFTEGRLTKLRSRVVSRRALARFAMAIHLGDYVLLGKGEAFATG